MENAYAVFERNSVSQLNTLAIAPSLHLSMSIRISVALQLRGTRKESRIKTNAFLIADFALTIPR